MRRLVFSTKLSSCSPAADHTFSVTANPQIITVTPGQTQPTTLSLTPINYFLGSVTLSCNNLPANVTCIFTPAGFTVDGTGTIPSYVTLTINTNSNDPVVGQLRTPNRGSANTRILACLLFPAGGSLLLLPFGKRRRSGERNALRLLSVLVVLGGFIGLGGCGSSNNNSGQSGIAAPGTSTFTVTETGTSSNSTTPVTHTLPLTLTVLGPQ